MNHDDNPAADPRVVEEHSLLVRFSIDEWGQITYAVTPERAVRDALGVTCLHLARQGAPLTLVAARLLTSELQQRLLVEVLERTEMRFRRAGRWEQAIGATPAPRALSADTADEEDRLH